MIERIRDLFLSEVNVIENIITLNKPLIEIRKDQLQTNDIFSEKWSIANEYENVEKLFEFQYNWFLTLYGFESLISFKEYLRDKKTIIDTGCGLGYKAAWFAKNAPHSLVIGIDISDSIEVASERFKSIPNLYFLKSDIASTDLKPDSIDFVVCDQVIMHTEVPENTFKHLSSITKFNGEFACYVYSKKALPRELIDDYFRKATHEISSEEMWKFSEQLTELGKRLSALNLKFESPDIPLLGIKGGEYDIQRFIYWNFLKCFWKEEWGFNLSKSTNYDWYAPSNAKRFSKDEFIELATKNGLDIFFLHQEEACYSARFIKKPFLTT